MKMCPLFALIKKQNLGYSIIIFWSRMFLELISHMSLSIENNMHHQRENLVYGKSFNTPLRNQIESVILLHCFRSKYVGQVHKEFWIPLPYEIRVTSDLTRKNMCRHSSYVLSLFSNIPRLLFSNGDFYVTVHMIFFQSDSRQTKQDNRTNLNGTPYNLLSTNPNPIRNNNFPDIIFKRTLHAKNVQKKQANNSKVELFHRFGYYYFTMHFEFPIQKLTSKTLLAIWFTDSCKNGHPI